MASVEQVEAWASEAADALKAKVGEKGSVIVIVMEGDKGYTQSAWRGYAPMTLWALEVGGRVVKEGILPKSIDRQNPKT